VGSDPAGGTVESCHAHQADGRHEATRAIQNPTSLAAVDEVTPT
jgi:hypothetical protein